MRDCGRATRTSPRLYVETPEYRQQVIAARPGSIIAQVFNNPGIAPRVSAAIIPTPCPAGFAAGHLPAGHGRSGSGLAQPARAGSTSTPARSPPVRRPRRHSGYRLRADRPAREHVQGNQYNGRIDFNPTADRLFRGQHVHLDARTNSSVDAAGGSRPLARPAIQAPQHGRHRSPTTALSPPTMLNEVRFNFTRFADDGVADAANVNFGIPRLEVEGLATPDRIRFGAPQSETTPSHPRAEPVRVPRQPEQGGRQSRAQDSAPSYGGSRTTTAWSEARARFIRSRDCSTWPTTRRYSSRSTPDPRPARPPTRSATSAPTPTGSMRRINGRCGPT